jgi:hypothetical protein
MQNGEERLSRIGRALAMRGIDLLTERSPVGNPSLWKNPAPAGYVGGRFKGNWQVEVGGINFDNSLPPDASGSGSIARGAAKIGAWDGIGRLYVTNSMPYSKRIEYEHWSQQAPAGLVRITARDLRAIVTSIARQTR